MQQPQRWDPALYDSRHAFVFERGRELLPLLDARPGERILDVGCGTAHLTAALAATGASVVGIDRSPDMIARASTAYPDLDLRVADVTELPFTAEFDAVFSNATLHWIAAADGAAAAIARALVPGGRFVAEFGGAGNCATLATALLRAVADETGAAPAWPLYAPTLGTYAALLERHGLAVTSAALFDRPTPLAGGSAGLRPWLDQFCSWALDPLSPDARGRVVARTEALARTVLFRDGTWILDYRRLRVIARREGVPA